MKARHKRLVGIYAAFRAHKNAEEISELKNKFDRMERQNLLQQDQILELGAFLNVTHGYVMANRLVINEIQVRLTELNATLLSLMDTFNVHQYIVFFLIEARASMSRINMGMLTLQQNVQGIYEYLRVISTHRINPLVIPPRNFKIILKGVRDKTFGKPKTAIARRSRDPSMEILLHSESDTYCNEELLTYNIDYALNRHEFTNELI